MGVNRFDVVGCTLFDYEAGWRIDFVSEFDARAALYDAQMRILDMDFQLGQLRLSWVDKCVGSTRIRPMSSDIVQRSNAELMA